MRPLSGQADRRARSRAALLEATARGLSRSGYGHLRLDAVAAEDGYTRGALHHQFPDKDAPVLATVAWVKEAWDAEVGRTFDEALSAVDALVALARRHAVYPIGGRPGDRGRARGPRPATLSAIEGAVIALAGNERDDEEVAERVARGLIGVS